MIRKLASLIILSLALATPLTAGKGIVEFCETRVFLEPSGKADVSYSVAWEVVEGELHGFDFGGFGRLKVEKFFTEQAYASDSQNRNYGLKIVPYTKAWDNWAIDLANGAGVGSGRVIFNFFFRTDFAQAGYLAATTNEQGRALAVFNWAPTQWDEAPRMDHYTLYLHTPHQIPPEVTEISSYVSNNQLVLTEPWVNKEYLIDYRRNDKNQLMLLFHKNNPPNLYQMRVQIYLPQEWFSGLGTQAASVKETQPIVSDKDVPEEKATEIDEDQASVFLIVGLVIAGLSFLVAKTKWKSLVKSRAELKDVMWENINWTAPKLILSDLTKKGKIAKDLTPIEAAFYLAIPVKRIVSSILTSWEVEGRIKIISQDPLKVQPLTCAPAGDPHSLNLFNAFVDDGELSQTELDEFSGAVVSSIREKAWDADVEATRSWYEQEIDESLKPWLE